MGLGIIGRKKYSTNNIPIYRFIKLCTDDEFPRTYIIRRPGRNNEVTNYSYDLCCTHVMKIFSTARCISFILTTWFKYNVF